MCLSWTKTAKEPFIKKRACKTFIIKPNQGITGTTTKEKKEKKKKKREREENKSLYKSKKERFEASFLKCLSGKNILKEHKFLKNY